MGGCAVDISRLEFGTDSSNQNTVEFIGVTMGLVALTVLGVTRPRAVYLRGDSTAALRWADTKRTKNTNASFVFVYTAIAMGPMRPRPCGLKATTTDRVMGCPEGARWSK